MFLDYVAIFVLATGKCLRKQHYRVEYTVSGGVWYRQQLGIETQMYDSIAKATVWT